MVKKISCILLASILLATTSAQERISIALYDVESIYDTTLYNPEWSSERYQRKIQNTVQVIDSLDASIVAIIGVANEAIVRDIVARSAQEYCYTYHPLSYFDKLDCALLYHGDYLTVQSVDSHYDITIEGIIDSLPIEIIITRRGGKVLRFESKSPESLRIIMGDLSHRDLKRLGMEDATEPLSQQGVGDTFGERGWYMQSRVGVAPPAYAEYRISSRVYYAKWLIDSDRRPLPTFMSGHYIGGYSSHLPIITEIEL